MYRLKQTYLLYLLLSTLAIVWGCRRDVKEFNPYVPSQEDLSLLLTQAPGPSTHTAFQFGGSIPDTTLTTASGVRVFLADTENLFADDAGTPVPCSTCPSLKIEVTNVFSKGDQIARGLNSSSATDGKMLESAGMVLIQATCKGQALQLLPNRYLKVQLPSNAVDNFELFTGAFDDQQKWPGWTASGDPVYAADWLLPGSGLLQKGYEMILPQLGWANCARPLIEQTSSFCVTLPNQFTALNSRVYLVFDNAHALAELKGDDDSSTFCYPEAPIGFTVRVLVVSKTGNQYWLQVKPWETGNNVVLPMSPLPMNEQDVLNVIRSL